MRKNRLIALLTCFVMLFSLAACGEKPDAPEQNGKTEEQLLNEENEIINANNAL